MYVVQSENRGGNREDGRAAWICGGEVAARAKDSTDFGCEDIHPRAEVDLCDFVTPA
jgi:hypothetical protein